MLWMSIGSSFLYSSYSGISSISITLYLAWLRVCEVRQTILRKLKALMFLTN